MDKWQGPTESPAGGQCRDGSAQQGGRGVWPEDGQVAPLPHHVLLQLIGDGVVADDGGAQPGVSISCHSCISRLLLVHIEKGRLWVEGGAWVELASGSATWAIKTGHESARRDGQGYCS
jgi:hypothetical protein